LDNVVFVNRKSIPQGILWKTDRKSYLRVKRNKALACPVQKEIGQIENISRVWIRT
jgi:hypothetical protein